jgi:EAL domain-containing protein (putative c-di-GMP-specific phosphodiesterase class I)/ActR/RegA family two-component response regulator
MNQTEMRVMIVEDNPADARLIQEALKASGGGGFKLVHESTLQNALMQLPEKGIDAIVLDLGLPGTAGLETLEKIHQADAATPVIVLTGSSDEAMAVEAIRLGAQDYLVKDKLNGGALARSLRYSVERSRIQPRRKQEPAEKETDPLLTPVWAEDIDVADILENERVESRFQPWVSLKKRSIVGFEGLCRGVRKDTLNLISPVPLLELSKRRNLLKPMDRLFRKKVLEGFAPAARRNPDLVLSVNFDTSVLNEDEKALDDFIAAVRANRLDPSHIAIEILESKSCELCRLKRFIENQRKLGFLIALDDIGAGYSNMERIAELKPDLIKVDRTLVMGLHQSYHKQEVFKCMVKLAHSLGALLIAEGAETEEETMRALELGADMIQGFYFSRPQKMDEEFLSGCEEKIDETARKFKSYLIRNMNRQKTLYQEYDRMMARMTAQLAVATPHGFDDCLKLILRENPEVECLFVLDEAGVQLSQMVYDGNYFPRESVFFKPSPRGTDHSLKEYYHYLMASGRMDYNFVTSPYLSLATGKLCVTLSALFRDAYGRMNVLCADVKPDSVSTRPETS